jgi:hypothetical protein
MTIHGLVKYNHEKSTLGILYAQNSIIAQIKSHLISLSKSIID